MPGPADADPKPLFAATAGPPHEQMLGAEGDDVLEERLYESAERFALAKIPGDAAIDLRDSLGHPSAAPASLIGHAG